jgi:hypothetical protein
MNLFDSIQDSVFNIAANTFGSVASWIPSDGFEVISGPILFKDATETAKILDKPYSPKNCMLEYKQGDFTGLFELAAGGSEEVITINTLNYGVLNVTSKWDGKTFLAELQQL